MSTYALAQRGTLAVTSSDTSPKDITLPSPVKPGSSFRIANIRDRRRDALVQHGSISITDVDVSPKDSAALGTAVDTVCAYVTNVTIREKRTNNEFGATVKLNSGTIVRATFGAVAAGDTIDIEFDVVEFKARRGATVRLLDANTVRVEWDGTLAAGETIDVAYEVWDIAPLGDDLKEILFRCQRILGYLAENMVQDMVIADQAGNIVQYRLRVFDTDVHAEAAKINWEAGMQTGELARVQVTQAIDITTNDRKSLIKVLDTVAATPGIG